MCYLISAPSLRAGPSQHITQKIAMMKTIHGWIYRFQGKSIRLSHAKIVT